MRHPKLFVDRLDDIHPIRPPNIPLRLSHIYIVLYAWLLAQETTIWRRDKHWLTKRKTTKLFDFSYLLRGQSLLECHRGLCWNLKCEILLLKYFYFTISMHFLYIYMLLISVYLSALTSSIVSFSLLQRTVQVENIIRMSNRQNFYEIYHEIILNTKGPEIWNLLVKFEILLLFY